MKTTARILFLALALLMVFALAACGGKADSKTGGDTKSEDELPQYRIDAKTLEDNGYTVKLETNRMTLSSREMAIKHEDGALAAYLYAYKTDAKDIVAYYFSSQVLADAFHLKNEEASQKGTAVIFGDVDHLIS